MRKSSLWKSFFALIALTCAAAACADLGGYLKRAETDYKWTKQAESTVGNVKIVNLKLRSQVWREIPWDHNVQIFLPQTMRYPKTAFLLITGGNPGPSDTLLGAAVAPRLEAPVVILYNIPNQPLFEGKSEDDLIAHTFQQYLQTGDATWPLLLPMVKSAVKTMDAVGELSKKEWAAPVEEWVVTGASKRGWTTYLTGATDRRVKGIAPMVFDNLNFERQMPRQLELWGKYSPQIDDYTRRGLQQQLGTERGKQLVRMVDPWFYRKELTMPKLLIHGSNDPYWSTDATRIYWNDLEGEKALLTLPNSGHGLNDRTRLLNGLTAFFHSVAGRQPMPQLIATEETKDGKLALRIRSTLKPREVRVWTARATDLDFRPVRWEATPAAEQGGEWRLEVPVPQSGGLSVFAEAEYQQDGRTFTLSTPSTVHGKRPAAAQ